MFKECSGLNPKMVFKVIEKIYDDISGRRIVEVNYEP